MFKADPCQLVCATIGVRGFFGVVLKAFAMGHTIPDTPTRDTARRLHDFGFVIALDLLPDGDS